MPILTCIMQVVSPIKLLILVLRGYLESRGLSLELASWNRNLLLSSNVLKSSPPGRVCQEEEKRRNFEPTAW